LSEQGIQQRGLADVGTPIRAIAPQRNASTAITVRPFDGESARRRAWPLPARRFAGCFRFPWSAPRAGESGTRLEILAVSRPVGCHHGILRQGDLPGLKQFLQKRFRVLSERLGSRLASSGSYRRRIVSRAAGKPVDKDRTDQSSNASARIEGRANPPLSARFAQLQVIAHSERLRHLNAGSPRAQAALAPRQVSLGNSPNVRTASAATTQLRWAVARNSRRSL